MSDKLEEIKPQRLGRVIDLVAEAGVDVSDWANVKGGEKNAASNPKYCYAWSFIQPNKVVVLNLWFESMHEQNGIVFQKLNLREVAHKYERSPKKPAWAKRSRDLDLAIQTAVRQKLAVRVIVCAGKMRDIENNESKASQVMKRFLDPLPWAVTEYNWENGDCIVTRDAIPKRFADQFSIASEPNEQAKKKTITSEKFVRDRKVRETALERANGLCAWCKNPGFTTPEGLIYLETHHIISLADGGLDNTENVIALCPNHHREAHLGANTESMQTRLLELVAQLNSN